MKNHIDDEFVEALWNEFKLKLGGAHYTESCRNRSLAEAYPETELEEKKDFSHNTVIDKNIFIDQT